MTALTDQQAYDANLRDQAMVEFRKGEALLGKIGLAPPAAPPPTGGASSNVPDPPLPPASYVVPTGAVSVSTAAGLVTELAKSVAEDIVLQTGTYDHASKFTSSGAHRLWAASLGGATLTAGIDFGSNSHVAGEVHGIRFNLNATAKAADQTSCVSSWGSPNSGLKVQDCWFDGGNVIFNGVSALNPHNLVAQRLVFTNLVYNGLRASDNSINSTAVITTITDINAYAIHASVYGSLGGTAESGVWIGAPVTNTVARLKFRDMGWMGLWTGNAIYKAATSFSDIDADTGVNTGDRVGVYLEHLTWNATFSKVLCGSGCSQGFVQEWDYNNVVGTNGSQTLPLGTILVNETIQTRSAGGIGFPATGTLFVGNPGSSIQTVTYTGWTNSPSPRFTGCSGGSGVIATNTIVCGDQAGGLATWRVTINNSQINASTWGVRCDNGTMFPTITNTVFTNCVTAAIQDRSNNPQCTSAANSNLSQSGNTFSQSGLSIKYG